LSDSQLFTNELLHEHYENCPLFTVPAAKCACCVEVGRNIMAEYNLEMWFSYNTSEIYTSIVLDGYKTSCKSCFSTDWQVNARNSTAAVKNENINRLIIHFQFFILID